MPNAKKNPIKRMPKVSLTNDVRIKPNAYVTKYNGIENEEYMKTK